MLFRMFRIRCTRNPLVECGREEHLYDLPMREVLAGFNQRNAGGGEFEGSKGACQLLRVPGTARL